MTMAPRSRVFAILLLLACVVLPGFTQVAADGKTRIAFQRDRSQNNATTSNIVVMFTDGSQPVELGETRELPGSRVTPALAPDGHTIAFAARVDDKYKIFTWTLDAENAVVGTPLRLTQNTDTSDKFPAWAPDGRKLAYLATDGNGKTSLRVINSDGTGMRVLADVNAFAVPSWNPTGTSLNYIDREANKPVLKNIIVTGGQPIVIRGDLKITAACYSPDGGKVAVLIQRADGMSDLWTISAWGSMEQKKLQEKIVGGKSLSWPTAETIIFNAVKVGTQGGGTKAFWKVSPSGAGLSGMASYADAKQVSYFTVQKSDLSAQLPNMLDPSGQLGPDGAAPKERVPNGPVTIIRPYADTEVHGTVEVRAITQPEVATVVMRIGDLFAYASDTEAPEGTIPTVKFSWNTQEFATIDPTRGPLPTEYQKLLKFPDGSYTVSVQALDKGGQLVGKDSIKVMVKNNLPEGMLPVNTTLRYQYKDNAFDRYFIQGEGQLFNATGSVGDLASSFSAQLRRKLIEIRPNGSADLRMELLRPSAEHYSLVLATKEVDVPETGVSALYTMTTGGDFSVIPQMRERVYLPLAQLSVPMPSDAIQMGKSWKSNMWIVADMLDREATPVSATNTIDGMEKINGRTAVRVRSDYKIEPMGKNPITININPNPSAPGPRGTRQAMAAWLSKVGGGTGATMPAGMGAMGSIGAMGVSPEASQVKVDTVQGVRYSWFDYERNTLLRVEDAVLYAFPSTNLPGAMTGQPGDGMTPGGMPGPAGYSPDNPPVPGGEYGGMNPTPPTTPTYTTGYTPRGSRTNPSGTTGGVRAPKPVTVYYVVRYTYERLAGDADAD